MNRLRRYLVHIAVFAVLLASLYLLTVLFATIPNRAIAKNMWRSAASYSNTDRYAFSGDGYFQNITDNYADQIWLNIGWNMGVGTPFAAALDTGYYGAEQYDSAVSLQLTVLKGEAANTAYTRYWHGTAGLLRLLHLFTDIQGVKTVGILCLLFLIWKTVRLLSGLGHGDLGICLCAALLLVQVWNLRLSVEYLPSFLICFLLCPSFLRLERKNDLYPELLSVVSGTLTAFFDFLTTETVTILLPLLLLIAIRSRERRLESPLKALRLLTVCGLCWLFAYSGTFLVKWTAVSLVTGENHFLAALDSLVQRINGNVSLTDSSGVLMALAANFTVLFNGSSRTEYPLVAVGLLLSGLTVMGVYRVNRIRQKLHPGTGYLLLLGSVVFLRYGLLANHSYLHAFFTYRALVSTVFSVLAALTVNLRPTKTGGTL